MNTKNFSKSGRMMLTRFSTTCAETGMRISKGDYIYLDTDSRQAFCMDSDRYKSVWASMSAQEQSIATNNCYYQRIQSNF